MLRIGTFSILANLNIRTLRFYDEEGLLTPAYIDPQNGYRYYDENQLPIIARIQALKIMGMNLTDIKTLLSKCNDKTLFEKYLSNLYEEKIKERDNLDKQLNFLKTTLYEINAEDNFNYNGIVLKKIPSRQVAVIKGNLQEYAEQGKLWQQLDIELEKQGIKATNPSYNIAYYHNVRNGIEVELQRAVISLGTNNSLINFKTSNKVLCATITFQGEYKVIPKVAVTVATWLKNSDYLLDGPVFHIYHNSPQDVKRKEENITEICYPLKNKKSINKIHSYCATT